MARLGYAGCMRWVGMVLLLVGMTAAVAQGPDAAVLAKAQAGDAAAQLAVGEALTKQAAQADPDERAARLAEATVWVRKAAEQGLVAAEVRLAECYRDGRGVGRDAAQAAQWYRRAAEAGNTTAQGTLGTMYAMGLGVERDDAEAYFWFAVAAEVEGPNQQKYAANRQQVGTRITAEELAEVQRRVKKWRVAHP